MSISIALATIFVSLLYIHFVFNKNQVDHSPPIPCDVHEGLLDEPRRLGMGWEIDGVKVIVVGMLVAIVALIVIEIGRGIRIPPSFGLFWLPMGGYLLGAWVVMAYFVLWRPTQQCVLIDKEKLVVPRLFGTRTVMRGGVELEVYRLSRECHSCVVRDGMQKVSFLANTKSVNLLRLWAMYTDADV